MAAAVANRQDVANLLLQTAFKQSASELPNLLPPGLPSFVSSTVLARQTRHSGGHSGHSRVSSGLDKEQISSSSAPARNLGSIPLIDARNRYGSTALHISATKSLTWFVLNLLTAGADWHVQDSYGLTPQQVAAKLGHRDVEQILSRWDAESRGLSKPPASGSRARERRKGRASRRLPALTDVESTPRMSEWTGSLIPTN